MQAIFNAAELTCAICPLAYKMKIGLLGQNLSKFYLDTSRCPRVTVGSKSWAVIHSVGLSLTSSIFFNNFYLIYSISTLTNGLRSSQCPNIVEHICICGSIKPGNIVLKKLNI